jgi:hypothetical protein
VNKPRRMSFRKKREKRPLVATPKESVEEFLARGGEIERCPRASAVKSERLSVEADRMNASLWAPVMNANPYGEWAQAGRRSRAVFHS